MITVSHLTKMYGLRTAVNDLSFEVKKGEVVGFLGPNGAGKSTTMKILTGFMPATLGKVTVAGFDVFDQTIEVKRNVGYLPETPPVYNEMTVLDYLDHAARLHQVPSAKRRASVGLAIDKTSLGHVAGRLIGNLSKGYKQRVGLAQTLVHNPAVLILDEPTVGLDPKQIIEIRELIKGLAGEHTVILSTHILPEVAATCQRVIVINKGRIVAQDTFEQLSNRLKRGQVFTLQVRQTEPSAIAALKSLPGVTSVSTEGSKILLEVAP
jgi:ABC-2 type transport system ATP-binding protein